MATDPKQLALKLSVARWKKFPADPIEQELDDADEWIKEASLMNKFLPDPVFKAGFGWQAVHPIEIKAAAIKTVQDYADFVQAHIKPLVLPANVAANVAENVPANVATTVVASVEAASADVAEPGTAMAAGTPAAHHVPDTDATLRFFAAGSGLDESELAKLRED